MMLKRIGANTLRYLLTLLVASLVIFIALRVIPGNPAEVALGVTATDESVAKLSGRPSTFVICVDGGVLFVVPWAAGSADEQEEPANNRVTTGRRYEKRVMKRL